MLWICVDTLYITSRIQIHLNQLILMQFQLAVLENMDETVSSDAVNSVTITKFVIPSLEIVANVQMVSKVLNVMNVSSFMLVIFCTFCQRQNWLEYGNNFMYIGVCETNQETLTLLQRICVFFCLLTCLGAFYVFLLRFKNVMVAIMERGVCFNAGNV